jgi:hypothetical protein
MNSIKNPLSWLTVATATTFLCSGADASLFINEVDSDTPGSDVAEFVEIYDGGVGNTPLDGYVLVFINGSDSKSYLSFDLDGLSTDASGFFVVGNPGVTNVDLTFAPGASGALQNGADGVGLYLTPTAPANGTVMTETGIVDGVAYDTADADIPGLLDIVYGAAAGPARVQVDENQFTTSATVSVSRPSDSGTILRDGREFVLATPTPGALNNVPTGSLTFNIVAASVTESDGGTATTATVTRTGSLSGDLAVLLSSSDTSEISVPTSVTILNGQASSDPFDVAAVDDLWPDGVQSATVTATSSGYGSAQDTLTVTDDAGDVFSLIVNEVYYGVDASLLDANNDGTADTSRPSADEFVEIINTTGAAINLSGYTVKENFAGSLHEFPAGTVVPAGAALVIFGGGEFLPGSTASFGTSEIQKASIPGLFLDDAGDFVQILNSLNQEVHRVALPDQTASPAAGSYTLATDALPASGYVYHTTLSGAAPYSPGLKVDNTPFVTLTTPLTLSVNVASTVENVPTLPNGATITIPGALAQDLVIRLYSSDTSELTVPDTVTLVAGQTSVSADIFPQNDSDVDGTKTVTVTATASGFLNHSDTVDVQDDGADAVVFTNLVINELDCDTPLADTAEFVELFNKSNAPQSLTGLVLVFFNGSNDLTYRAINLVGTIPANGYFVVGNTGTPNVNLTFPNDSLQNGQDAVALYVGSAASFPNNTTLAQAALAGTLVDAVVYDTNDADDAALLAAFTPGKPQVDEAGAGSSDVRSIARVPNGGGAFDTALFVAQAPTPGATNILATDFDTWAGQTGATGGMTGDTDLDGRDNAFEYAFGLSPTSGGSVTPFTSILNKTTGEFTFTRRKPSLTGLAYTYQYHTSLTGAWTAFTPAVTPTTNGGDPVEAVTVTVPAVLLTEPKLFIRIVTP